MGELVEAHVCRLKAIRDGVDRMRGGKVKRMGA
jgi:hypothetical protein